MEDRHLKYIASSQPRPEVTELSDPGELPPNPVISVIVPTYMHGAYLEEAVTSIIAQEANFHFEVIIAEDCSPDNTRAIAIELQRRYPSKVRLIYTDTNQGATINVRLAIESVKGRYVAVCDGDDFWVDPKKLARQVQALDRLKNVDMAFTRGWCLYSDGRREQGWNYGPEARVIGAKELFAGAKWIAPMASVVWRVEVMRSLPKWLAYAPSGDLYQLIAGSARGGAFYESENTICYRVAQPTSFTVAWKNAEPAALEKFYEDVICYINGTCDYYSVDKTIMRERLTDYHLSLAKLRLSVGKPLRSLISLLRMSPDVVAKKVAARVSGSLLRRYPKRN